MRIGNKDFFSISLHFNGKLQVSQISHIINKSAGADLAFTFKPRKAGDRPNFRDLAQNRDRPWLSNLIYFGALRGHDLTIFLPPLGWLVETRRGGTKEGAPSFMIIFKNQGQTLLSVYRASHYLLNL